MTELTSRIESIFRSNPKAATEIVTLMKKYVERIGSQGKRDVKVMNFCGTHEWTTVHFGLRSIMPREVDLVAGPGCPVCVTPRSHIEGAIKVAMEGTRVYTYGDAYRLPSSPGEGIRSLQDAKARGGNVKVVYSFLDAIIDARSSRAESMFLGIGFETTHPSYALPIGKGQIPEGMHFLSSGKLTSPAARFIMQKGILVDGVIAPGHVSVITGASEWEFLAREYRIPTVISGFDPIDVLLSSAEILRQISRGESTTIVEYTRAVSREGNLSAKRLISEVFETSESHWRGMGTIPGSGYQLREKFRRFDATQVYEDDFREVDFSEEVPKGCLCSEVVMGRVKPDRCPMFMTTCTPEIPYGPCMVSSEGTCSVWARYGQGRSPDLGGEELEA